jgi:hypothetical protein
MHRFELARELHELRLLPRAAGILVQVATQFLYRLYARPIGHKSECVCHLVEGRPLGRKIF